MITRILTALSAGYEAATNNYRGEPTDEPAARILRQDEVALAPVAPADVNMAVRAELARIATLIDDTAHTSTAAADIVRDRINELLPAGTRRRP